jgi:hypothetical protein
LVEANSEWQPIRYSVESSNSTPDWDAHDCESNPEADSEPLSACRALMENGFLLKNVEKMGSQGEQQ